MNVELAKIQLQLFRYCKYSSRIFNDDCGKTYTLAFAMVQPWKKPFGKAKALEFEVEYEIELEAGVTGT